MESCRLLGVLFLHIFVPTNLGLPLNNSGIPDGLEGETDRADPVFYVRDDFNDTKKYLVIDDMIISKDPSKAGLVNNAWPNAIVPYTFALTISHQQKAMITQAIAELSARTCISFRSAKKDDPYWLLFQNDPMNQGCYSYVGWQNRKNQQLQISANCAKGNAIHEIIHALGFYHEHTRNDRDEYVTVYYDNVNSGQVNNFKKDNEIEPPPETSFFDYPYNYDSIMHYGRMYFSKNGKPTIEPLNHPGASGKGEDIGQRDHISTGDAEMVRKKYNCPKLTDVEDGFQSTKPPPSPPVNSNPLCNFLSIC